jgi:PPP family 3-phenylpropionic acid transporter
VSRDGHFDIRRYGRVRLWGSMGFLVTVLLAGTWFDAFGMGSFALWTTLTLAAVALSTWWLPNAREPVAADARPEPVGPVLRQPRVRWFFAAVFFHVMAHVFIYVFLSLHLDAQGYAKSAIGLLWSVSVLIEIGWFFTQGRWLPAPSLPGWLVLGGALTALRMAVTAGLPSVWPLLALAQLLHAITFAAHHTVCMAWITQHFPGRLRGRGQALYSVLGYGLSGVSGGLLGGVISSRFGLASVFWVGMGCGAVAALCALRLRALDRPSGRRR